MKFQNFPGVLLEDIRCRKGDPLPHPPLVQPKAVRRDTKVPGSAVPGGANCQPPSHMIKATTATAPIERGHNVHTECMALVYHTCR
jgi:hypothetical protein